MVNCGEGGNHRLQEATLELLLTQKHKPHSLESGFTIQL